MMRNKYLIGNNKKQAGYPSGEKNKKNRFPIWRFQKLSPSLHSLTELGSKNYILYNL